jgi:pimeloyl-ACP methyl ester carboxylesterase
MSHRSSAALAALVLAAASFHAAAAAAPAPGKQLRNIVIVPGAFADGSGWHVIHDILSQKGYKVTVVPASHNSLDEDIALTRRILFQQFGNVVLVGSGIGGAVINHAGTGAKVKSLVYVAAIVPEIGESAGQLIKSTPGATSAIQADFSGYYWFDRARFHEDFAADLTPNRANYLAASQVPVSQVFLGTPAYASVWHQKPSYAIVAAKDRVLNPDAQRTMYQRAHAKTIEIDASHAVHMSRPEQVADFIERAARETL